MSIRSPSLPSTQPHRTVSLQRALLLLIATALLAGIVPAGVALNRLLGRELESRAATDLGMAPQILADRNAALADAVMMLAKDVAGAPGLAEAVVSGDRQAAIRVLGSARGAFTDEPILLRGPGELWAGGPSPDSSLVLATQRGEMPVAVVPHGSGFRVVALAPVKHGDEWVGAAGVTRPLDETAAGTLAGLTRSDVLILNARGEPAAASVPDSIAQPLAAAAGPLPVGKEVHTVSVGAQRYLVAKSTLGGSASVLFARDLREELAVLPEFRRILVVMGVAALALALLLGALLASRLSRPVRGLAAAADRIGEGDFDAPVEPSRVREIDRLAHAFDAMRSALSAHLGELRSTNRELADREARLTALQSEIIQRERLAASGRMAAELAHEIRNPVASLRNCLELLLRRVQDDPVGREFANLAIDELLRMHELAERMLDLNRPGDPAVTESDTAAVAREVGALVRAGAPEDGFGLSITGEGSAPAAIPPDALKQVLLNLVYNAREARPRDLHLGIQVRDAPPHVRVFVTDNGPGIAADILPQLFDPFFTTKSRTGGVGLGLSVAAGIIRKHGGRLWAENRTDGSGACFGIELPAASQESGPLPDSHSTSPEPVAE